MMQTVDTDKTAGMASLHDAFRKAYKQVLEDENCTASMKDAGFVRACWSEHHPQLQVFVKVCRFSEDLLEEQPETGGLLCEADSVVT